MVFCVLWFREYFICKFIIVFFNFYIFFVCRIKGYNVVFIGIICMFEVFLYVFKFCVYVMIVLFLVFLFILSVVFVFWGCIFFFECLWVYLWMVFGFEESCYLGWLVVMVCSELVVWKCGFIGGSLIGDWCLFCVWLLGVGVYFFVVLFVVELWWFERFCFNFVLFFDFCLWLVNLLRKI